MTDVMPSHERMLEVAALLPRDLAKVVTEWPPSYQKAAVGMLALCIDYWEEQGIQLDPIQFSVVVTSIVMTSVSQLSMMGAMAQVIQEQASSP